MTDAVIRGRFTSTHYLWEKGPLGECLNLLPIWPSRARSNDRFRWVAEHPRAAALASLFGRRISSPSRVSRAPVSPWLAFLRSWPPGKAPPPSVDG